MLRRYIFKMIKLKAVIFALLPAMLLTACGLDDILEDSPLPKRNVTYAGPVTYGNITPELIPALTDIELVSKEFKLEDILVNETFKSFIDSAEQLGIPVQIPRKNWGTVAIYEDSISSVVESLTMERFELTFSLTNNFPLPIVGGENATKLLFVQENGDTIASHALQKDTLQEGETYDFVLNLSDKTISNNTNIFIHDFTTDSTKEITIDGDENFVFDMRLEVAEFQSLRVFTDQDFQIDETLNFNIDSAESLNKDKTEGELTFYITNNLPANTNMQFYFMNNGTITDSLFDNGSFFIKGVPVGNDGIAIEDSLDQESEEIILVDSAKIHKVYNAKQIRVKVGMNTRGTGYPYEQNYMNVPGAGESVKADQNSYIDFQVAGDVSTELE